MPLVPVTASKQLADFGSHCFRSDIALSLMLAVIADKDLLILHGFPAAVPGFGEVAALEASDLPFG